MHMFPLTQLSWPLFTQQFKLIKNLHSQSFYSPASLYLNIKTKQKHFIKEIAFQTSQQLQIILNEIQKTHQSFKINQRQYLCHITAFCIKQQTKISNSRQTSLLNKEGKVLLLFEQFKTLQEIVQSFLLSPSERSFIQADSDIVTIRNYPYLSSILTEKTLINIFRTLLSTVLFLKQFNVEFIKSFTLQMIEIQNLGEIEQKCKVFFYPFAENDIVQLVWNEEFLIEHSYVGQKVLQIINRFENNQFRQINIQTVHGQNNYTHNKKSQQIDTTFSLSYEDIYKSQIQSIGLLVLKLTSLSLGKQTFLQTKFYKMNQNYQLSLNFQTIQFLLSQIKKNAFYSKTFVDKIEKLIFQNQNLQIISEMIKSQLLSQIQKQKNSSPYKQRKTFSIGKPPAKQKKYNNANLNLTPSKKIGIQMNKLINRSSFELNQTLKQKKLTLNQREKPISNSNSNSRSNSIMRDKSKFLPSLSKSKEFSPSLIQKNQQSSTKKSLSPYQGSNKNADISVNSGIAISSERQKFIESLKQKILYDPNTGLIHENIISKQFRDGSTYLGQYNPAKNIKEGYGLYFYFDGDIYGGTWKNDQLNGLGIYYFANGDSYEGGVVNGQKDGYGVYNYGNGNMYKGYWKKDKKEGKGEFFYTNGDSYVGQFAQGRKQGHGLYKWANGDTYEGNFCRNMKNGNGSFKKANSQNVIKGEWQNDFFVDNQGAQIFYGNTGKIYQGKVLQNGVIDGYGMFQFQKDGYFEGQIRNNSYQGECTINYDNGDIFKGQMKNDLFEGYGEYYFAEKNFKYIGSWVKGKQHGIGQLIYVNQGTMIETKWQNGNFGRHKGIIIYKDGTKYEGDISQSGRHGRGRYFYKDGKWIEGQFDSNKLVYLYQISQ